MTQEPQATHDLPVPAEPEAPPRGGLLFRYRNALPVTLAVCLVACPPAWRLAFSPWQLIAGGALVLSGVAGRIWCILQIGGSARKTSKLKADRVISWGPYSLVRNPIYLANSTTFLGFVVAAGLPWFLPVVILALFLWYNSIVCREEQFLEEKHPEAYAAYKQVARRWWPSLRYKGRPEDIAPYPFLRALKRERGHLIAVSVGAAAVILLRIVVPRIWSG